MGSDAEAFVAGLSPGARTLVDALRMVVRRAAPTAQESLLWGGLSYHRPDVGGRVKGAVCLITAGRHGVRLEFIHGIRLSDPAGLLQGTRLSKRHVPIGTLAEADLPEIADLIERAAGLTWTAPEPS